MGCLAGVKASRAQARSALIEEDGVEDGEWDWMPENRGLHWRRLDQGWKGGKGGKMQELRAGQAKVGHAKVKRVARRWCKDDGCQGKL